MVEKREKKEGGKRPARFVNSRLRSSLKEEEGEREGGTDEGLRDRRSASPVHRYEKREGKERERGNGNVKGDMRGSSAACLTAIGMRPCVWQAREKKEGRRRRDPALSLIAARLASLVAPGEKKRRGGALPSGRRGR